MTARLALASAWLCGCGGSPEGTIHDMGPDVRAPEPEVDASQTCPFTTEPDCTGTACPDDLDWVCVQQDPPSDASTCRLACEDDCPAACQRVCAPLLTGGGACVVGTGPGEPCNPETCNPGLDCIVGNIGAFCRTRCGPTENPMYCVEKHFFCYDRRDPMTGDYLGGTCGPYFGSLQEGEDCSGTSSYCSMELLCATHEGATTCARACDPSLDPTGCDDGGTCQRAVDEESHGIGYVCR